MEKFKSYVNTKQLNEGVTDASTEIEYALVDQTGGKSGKTKVNLAAHLAADGKFTGDDRVSNYAKTILKNAKITGKGKMSKNMPVNKGTYADGIPKWQGTNTTPKTDIIIGAARISLKSGSSQLMSGSAEEALSTFDAATHNSPKMTADMEKLGEEIKTGILGLLKTSQHPDKFKGSKTTLIKSGLWDKDEILVKADKHNKVLQQKFVRLFEQKEFKQAFVFEAMTGKTKFNDSDATADHFLVVDWNGKAKYKEVKDHTSKYVKDILGRVSPNVKFKTGSKPRTKTRESGFYSFRSVIGLMYAHVNEANEELQAALELQGDVLTEGFSDVVKGIWNRVMKFFSELWNKVWTFITMSAASMADFLGVVPYIPELTKAILW